MRAKGSNFVNGIAEICSCSRCQFLLEDVFSRLCLTREALYNSVMQDIELHIQFDKSQINLHYIKVLE